jgi:hypothetical protein
LRCVAFVIFVSAEAPVDVPGSEANGEGHQEELAVGFVSVVEDVVAARRAAARGERRRNSQQETLWLSHTRCFHRQMEHQLCQAPARRRRMA